MKANVKLSQFVKLLQKLENFVAKLHTLSKMYAKNLNFKTLARKILKKN